MDLKRRIVLAAAAAAAAPARGAGEVHHRRVDDLDRAVGSLRPPPADLREGERHQGAGRRARHRAGARHGPARRRRRRVRARPRRRRSSSTKDAASNYKQVMYNDFVIIGSEVGPGEGRRRQGRARGTEEDRGVEGAFVSRADKSGTHAAELGTGSRRASTLRRRKAPGTKRRAPGMGRPSTPLRR